MDALLMHKNVPVAKVVLEDSGWISKVEATYNPSHLPIGIHLIGDRADKKELSDWWIRRSIPASRSGIRETLEALDIGVPQVLLSRCYGLSLSDHYWIKLCDSQIAWETVNFFYNEFSDDIGDLLFGKRSSVDNIDFNSPDNTSDGWLKKRWKIIDGNRCLIKGGSAPFHQQPFNEVAATRIASALNIPHIPYDLLSIDGKPYSVCKDFVDGNSELVSAHRVLIKEKKPNHISEHRHFIDVCDREGIDVARSVDEMLVLDYIIANTDRHFNNFGILRNPDTLEWIGFAPVYDSGTSFGCDELTPVIKSQIIPKSKPFKDDHLEQLKLVSSFDGIDFSKLYQAVDEVRDIFYKASEAIQGFGDDRSEAIVQGLLGRIDALRELSEIDKVSKID